jgi:hypothetical protein
MLKAYQIRSNLDIKLAMTKRKTSFGFVVIADDRRIEEVQCMIAAISHCHDRMLITAHALCATCHGSSMWHKMLNPWCLSGLVAKALGYEYTPGITWDKSKLMWANTSK